MSKKEWQLQHEGAVGTGNNPSKFFNKSILSLMAHFRHPNTVGKVLKCTFGRNPCHIGITYFFKQKMELKCIMNCKTRIF